MVILTIAGWAGSAVVKEVISVGFSYVRDHVLPADTKAELKRLEAALPKITTVMGIAEALRMKDPSARQWVEQFRQAVEASEDVLDELEYKKLEDMVKGQDEVGGSTSSSKEQLKKAVKILEYKKKLEDMVKGRDKVGRSASSSKERLKRLKAAVKMLDEAAKGVENVLQVATLLGIHNLSESQQESGKDSSRETSSFLTETKVFGRQVEKEKIIGWLKQPTDARLSSFGIVGVGGLGKTTLAQFVYQEMHGSNYFDKIIWICVSTNFSVKDTTRKMLGELGESSFSAKPLNALQETLKEKIHLKKLLIILDDLWDDEKMRDWEQLVAPLRFVQQGSKILFTTRMKSVGELLESVIGTEHESLALQGLGEEDLRLLFQNYAFRRFNSDNHTDLQAIGDQILKMLRGSPLAAKVIGSLLNSNMYHQYWRRILKHGSLFNLEQAKDVVEVLKLSYYHLPANLQQQLCQEESPENIGENYFNHLLGKSFFELHSKKGKTWYTMHDLIHELAQNVSYGECCRIEDNNDGSTIPSTVRHVFVRCCHATDRVSHLENLRSLVIDDCSDMSSLNNLMKKPLRLLKVKVFCRTGVALPKEISCLVHLRYLSIGPVFKEQPFQFSFLGSIYKLYHLQLLEFSTNSKNTSHPRIETTGITNLLRLRYMRLPNNIIETICGLHKMTSLQELTFRIGKEIGYCIDELRTLNNLRHLSIENIENIGDHTEAKSANLLGKNDLMSLSLKWTKESNPIHPEKIIDHLRPPPSLMELTIENYNGQRCPNWMEDSPSLNLSSLKLLNCPLWENQLISLHGFLQQDNLDFPAIEKLTIKGCERLVHLPTHGFGMLTSLNIVDCPNLTKFPTLLPLSLTKFRINCVGLSALPEYYQSPDSSSCPSISSLKIVEIQNCQYLRSLNGFLQEENIDFQSIEKIEVKRCENLVHLPMGAFGKFVLLQKLTISDCPMLMAVEKQSTLLPMALRYLSIENCGKVDEPLLESASSLPTLTNLCISDCKNISCIPSSENAFRSLNDLHISGCNKLVEHSSREQAHGADRGSCLASLKIKELYIDNLSLLLIEPLRSLSFVSCLIVSNCSWMEALLEQWLLQNRGTLKNLSLWDVRNLNTLPATMVRLTVLEWLAISRGADLLEELPELPASLRDIYIWNASSLKSLPATMARLTTLETLKIIKADLLEELPELPASLEDKYIEGCGGRLL